MPTTTRVTDPLENKSAQQIHQEFLRIMVNAEYAALPVIGENTFAGLSAELSNRPRLFTFVDLFCGAGGSSIGLTMAGGKLLFAANHSKVAIATHATNFPDADHECADINHYDMRNLPRGADVLWGSPICTEISPAGGNKRTRKGNPDQFELIQVEGSVARETFERTRATFQDVIRAAEAHRFKYVIVENVVEAALDWELFGWWLDGMAILGYQYQIVCVSSAHVGGALNPHAPQRRDRMYVVFHRKDVHKPDVTPRPLSHCETCGTVEGVQLWKKPKGRPTASGRHFLVGKYGIRNGQYVYVCPNGVCRNSVVTPYERPAATVIDWTDLGQLIGDRAANDPLAESTLRRIKRGLELFGRPALVNSAHDDDRAYPVDRTPFPSRTTKIGDGLACPPFLDANGGSWNTGFAGVNEPFRTRTTSEWEGLVVPAGAFIETQRANVVPTSAWSPFTAMTAGGNHHGLVVPYYTKGKATPTSQALPTVTTKDRFGMAVGGDGAELDVMACRYRMIQWHEQARAQRFPVSYEITGNQGERTAQAGNAVSSNVAQWLGEAIAEALHRGRVLA